MKKYIKISLVLLQVSALMLSCKKKSEDNPTPEPVVESISVLEKEVLNTYSSIALASYEDAWFTADSLRILINEFCDAPSQNRFETCKTAWKRSRLFYGQTEAFRGANGPIEEAEGYINGWPLDEAYIDYVYDSTKAKNVYGGIINDTTQYKTIDEQTLIDANEKLGDASISTGYHAIEFLLWGQDFYSDGAGKREFTDYTTAPNADRRKQYLKVVAQLLVKNLEGVKSQWTGDFKTDLLTTSKLNFNCFTILSGIAQLSKGEFGGERIQTALDTKNQEDEHSCFSDNTHIDIQMNAKGMYNIYTGSYLRRNGSTINGKGLNALVEKLEPASNAKASAQISKAVSESKSIAAPFDQAILTDPNSHIINTIKSWQGYSDAMQRASVLIQSAK